MSKKLLFNFNREVVQNYTYVKYVGTIITATNTLEKPIKSAILKGSTKYRDIDTGEVLDAFEDGRNLELVSVRMPVLTTIGSNLAKESYVINPFYSSLGMTHLSEIVDCISLGTTFYIKGYNIPITIHLMIVEYDGDSRLRSSWISLTKNETIRYTVAKENCNLIKIVHDVNCIEKYGEDVFYTVKMMVSLNENLPTMNHEPYKSNILTVNEPIELRGIGDVQDELNLMTGELTQNIAEAVLSTFESYAVSTSNGIYYMAKTKVANDISPSHTLIIGANKFISKIYSEGGGNFEIQVSSKEDGTYPTRAELSEYLSQNPLILCYIPTTSTIKTVDLSILDQNENKISSISSFNDTTHITASSEIIPPIFEGYLATKEVE